MEVALQRWFDGDRDAGASGAAVAVGPQAQMRTTSEVHKREGALQGCQVQPFSVLHRWMPPNSPFQLLRLLPVQGIAEASPRTAAAVAAVFRELNPDLGASSASVVSVADSSADSVPAGLEPARAGGAGSGAVSLEVGFRFCLVPTLQA